MTHKRKYTFPKSTLLSEIEKSGERSTGKYGKFEKGLGTLWKFKDGKEIEKKK